MDTVNNELGFSKQKQYYKFIQRGGRQGEKQMRNRISPIYPNLKSLVNQIIVVPQHPLSELKMALP